jgi:hypothetical protein
VDLSEADIRLLSKMRKRSRVAKAVSAIFGLKGLLLTGVAGWFATKASSPPLIMDQHDPFWSLELLVRQGNLSAAGLFGVHALLCLSFCLCTWNQRKSDALTLKLFDRVSGYPTTSQ